MDHKTIVNIDNKPINVDEIKFWKNPADNVENAIIIFNNQKTRLRAGMLIVKEGKYVLLGEEANEPGVFSLPGGSIEPNESIEEAALRECQEEVRVTVKNIKLTRHDYCECHTEAADWVKQNVKDENMWWYNYYTCLCIGEYDSEFKGKVDKVDQDPNMKNTSKFYPIAEVLNDPSFKLQWKKALFDGGYIKRRVNLQQDQENRLTEKIVKIGSKYQVQSEKGRNMGTYDTKSEAEKRLKQIEYFKHLNEDKAEKLYHISEKILDKTMHPEIPESDYEDQKTPRICFAKTIQGCLIGAYEDKDLTGKVLHVYSTISDYYQPTKEEVADVEATGEVWVLHDVDPTYEYDIKITGTDESKTYNINGNEFNVPIWNFKKINKEEIELKPTDNRLVEDTRNQFIAKSRNVDIYKDKSRGKNRWERKKFSKVSTSTQKYNTINMDDFFKKDLLEINIPVTGETNSYTVTIQMDGVCAELAKNIKANKNVFEYKTIIQALTKIFNTTNIKVKCDCKDFQFSYAHNLIINNNSVDGTDKDPGPGSTGTTSQRKGQGCKHVLAALNSTDWILKAGSVLKNYILYMAEHKKSLFNRFIFPKLYGMTPEDAKEEDLLPEETKLDSNKNLIDEINLWSKNRGKFVKGSNKNMAAGKGKLQGPEENKEEAAD